MQVPGMIISKVDLGDQWECWKGGLHDVVANEELKKMCQGVV